MILEFLLLLLFIQSIKSQRSAPYVIENYAGLVDDNEIVTISADEYQRISEENKNIKVKNCQ